MSKAGRFQEAGNDTNADFLACQHQDISIVWSPVRGGVLVDPVLFFPGHAAAPGYLASRTGPVELAAFRPVTECLEPVLLLRWVPLVDDHLDRHSAVPDTGHTLRSVGPDIQASMATLPVYR